MAKIDRGSLRSAKTSGKSVGASQQDLLRTALLEYVRKVKG